MFDNMKIHSQIPQEKSKPKQTGKKLVMISITDKGLIFCMYIELLQINKEDLQKNGQSYEKTVYRKAYKNDSETMKNADSHCQ